MARIPEGATLIDNPISADSDQLLIDAIADDNNPDPCVLLADKKMGNKVEQWIEKLPDRERDVIQRRFGLHNQQSETLAEVGDALGVTRERVRQIQIQALKRLRQISEADGLSEGPFMDE